MSDITVFLVVLTVTIAAYQIVNRICDCVDSSRRLKRRVDVLIDSSTKLGVSMMELKKICADTEGRYVAIDILVNGRIDDITKRVAALEKKCEDQK